MSSTHTSTLYDHIKTFAALRPWSFFSETDIFAIRDPRSGTLWFASIMGEARITEGISFYEGPEALAGFWDLQRADPPKPDDILTIPHLIITFDSPKVIDPQQKEFALAAGYDQKKWPDIRENIPGWRPDYPAPERLTLLETLLEQSIGVIRRANRDMECIHPAEDNEIQYLVREFSREKGKWTDNYLDIEPVELSYKITFPSEIPPQLKSKPKKPEVVQIDASFLPTPVKSDDGRVFFPLFLSFYHKRKEILLGFENIPPFPDLKSAYERIPAVVAQKLLELPFKPFQIEVRSPLLAMLLTGLTQSAGIALKQVRFMQSLDRYLDDLREELG